MRRFFCKVYEARNGREGLNMIRGLQPDLVTKRVGKILTAVQKSRMEIHGPRPRESWTAMGKAP
jgi:hypothetical protein